MDEIETIIDYCKRNGGTIMFPEPLHLELPYDDLYGDPDLLGLKFYGSKLYIVDMWENYTRPETRTLRGLYYEYVKTVCDYSIRWLKENLPIDKNLF